MQTAQVAVGMHFDHAVAGVFSAAVDAQDSHVRAVYRGKGSDPSGQSYALGWVTGKKHLTAEVAKKGRGERRELQLNQIFLVNGVSPPSLRLLSANSAVKRSWLL